MAEKMDLEALKAQLKAEIMAEFEAERAKTEKKEPKTKLTANQKRNRERLEERVPVFLFKDGKEYKDDVFVGVNGRTIAIKRGVPVMVKRKFANVIKQSQKQQIIANEYALAKQEEFRNESRKYD